MQLADTAALESQRITRDTSADKKVLRETTQGITKQIALPLSARFTATHLLDLAARPVGAGRQLGSHAQTVVYVGSNSTAASPGFL